MGKECKRCGNIVTDDYHRVNSDNYGDLWSCIECTPNGETLTSADDTSESSLYERHLSEIQSGEDVAAIKKNN